MPARSWLAVHGSLVLGAWMVTARRIYPSAAGRRETVYLVRSFGDKIKAPPQTQRAGAALATRQSFSRFDKLDVLFMGFLLSTLFADILTWLA